MQNPQVVSLAEQPLPTRNFQGAKFPVLRGTTEAQPSLQQGITRAGLGTSPPQQLNFFIADVF